MKTKLYSEWKMSWVHLFESVYCSGVVKYTVLEVSVCGFIGTPPP